MKKLVFFSAILLGFAGTVSAQTGKKGKETKVVEPATKTATAPAATTTSARKPSPAKPVPAAAQSLFQANSAAAKKN